MSASLLSLIEQADAATAAGNLRQAEELLLKASATAPEDNSLLLKIAALQRATGRPETALATVHRALTVQPLDFTALLLRASLLDRMNHAEAPEAWSHALAQRPAGDVPQHLVAVVKLGEERVRDWTAEREQKMTAAMAPHAGEADEDERRRLERFSNNILRRTKSYHSEPIHFHFPELAEREFYPRRFFPWINALEQATETIVEEMQAGIAAERAELVPYVQYADHQPLDQWRTLNNNADWSAIHLVKNGATVEANARLFPNTLAMLAAFDQPNIAGASPNAMFSLLAPHTSIPPHVGVSNARLVCHLPLVVPEGCWFRVGAETRSWQKGQAFVFDDTIEHEAMNPTDQLRIVLIFDVWHPDLSPVERQAVATLIETAAFPGEGL